MTKKNKKKVTWETGEWLDSPSISSIIQEIVDNKDKGKPKPRGNFYSYNALPPNGEHGRITYGEESAMTDENAVWLSQVKDAQGNLLLPSLSKVCDCCQGRRDAGEGFVFACAVRICVECLGIGHVPLPVNGGDIIEHLLHDMRQAGWTYHASSDYWQFVRTEGESSMEDERTVMVVNGNDIEAVALAARRAIEAWQKEQA